MNAWVKAKLPLTTVNRNLLNFFYWQTKQITSTNTSTVIVTLFKYFIQCFVLFTQVFFEYFLLLVLTFSCKYLYYLFKQTCHFFF